MSKLQDKFMAELHTAYKSKQFTDMIIRCQDQEIPAHRVIVCACSKFFKAALGGQFSAAKEKAVTLYDDLEPVEQMFEYMYISDYSISNAEVPVQDRSAREENYLSLLCHIRMYAIGQKYDIAGVTDLANSKFIGSMYCRWDFEEYADLAALTYATTPESDGGLRKTMRRGIAFDIPLLLRIEKWRSIIKNTLDLSFDVILEFSSLSAVDRKKDPNLKYFAKDSGTRCDVCLGCHRVYKLNSGCTNPSRICEPTEGIEFMALCAQDDCGNYEYSEEKD